MRHWFAALTVVFAVLAPSFVCQAEGGAGGIDFSRLDAAAHAARKEALSPPDEKAAMAGAIRGYLGAMDPYSTYITGEEYASLHNAPLQYGGVGMDLIQGVGGLLYCLPYSDGPAAKSGISPGDVLFSVNGVPVSRDPFLVLESRIRGEVGTYLSLGIVSSGTKREVRVQRASISRASAELMLGGTVRRIRIWRFDANTVEQLAQCLAKLHSGEPLILDLRGNVGGDLKAAVACADLFLPAGSPIVTLESREVSPRLFRASQDAKKVTGKLAVWQDAFTASAAEVFCAALHDNGAAQTFGQTSFGKGVAQSIIPAGDSGFFVITTGRLLRPLGNAFHNEGLKPDHYVSDTRAPVEQNYLRRTYEIFGIQP